MQIEVVDDYSTKDDPAAVVRELSPDRRIGFHRQPKNGGATNTFNTCISRSRGQLVHILHGDDFVLPGFYSAVEEARRQNPSLSAFFTRGLIVDQGGSIECLTPRSPALEKARFDSAPLWAANCIPTPGVVITRAFYEQQGGFLSQLCHVADWEMWCRVLDHGGGVLVNIPLVAYRQFPGNDTGRLAATGENLLDYLRLASILQERHRSFTPSPIIADVSRRAWIQALGFRSAANLQAARANSRIWLKHTSARGLIAQFATYPRAFFRILTSCL
jgi:glycosyltransferase involved in cell wall biosynthesis